MNWSVALPLIVAGCLLLVAGALWVIRKVDRLEIGGIEKW